MTRNLGARDCAALLHEAEHALTRLSPREELLLRLRFGIGGRRQPNTVIARHFGLRPQDLDSLESRALNHLRQIAIAAEAQT